MKVVFMRHAESEYNVKRTLNNEPKNKDASPLTEKGREQAGKSALKLKDRKFDVVFCSEFLRTRQTAEIVNAFHKVELVVDKRVNEVNVGFEGRPAVEFDKMRLESGDEFNFKLKGKESWNDLVARAAKFLEWLKKQKYNCVLVVSHQWTTGAMIQVVKKLTNEEAMKHLLGLAEFVEAEI